MVTVIAIEHCTVDDIGLDISGEGAPPLVAAVNKYLATFAKPVVNPNGNGFMFGRHLCLKCEEPLGGMGGTFKWGLRSGEGKCGNCGWPARAHHRPTDTHGNIFGSSFEFILQYHPDFVRDKNAEGQQEVKDSQHDAS